MRGHDQRRARGEAGEQPRRNEEVCVDDVGPGAAGGEDRAAREPSVLRLAALAARQHGALDRVPASRERLLEAAHEDAVVGLGVAGVHLRDEQDAHVPQFHVFGART